MSSKSPVELADRISRKRAIVFAIAALAFLLIHVVFRSTLLQGAPTARYLRMEVMWAINAVILLLALATGGGLLNNTRIRALVNDEVARINYRSSVIAGFWAAMVVAFALYVLTGFRDVGARDAINAIVTSSVLVALFAFSWLEYRAHRDE
jgi:hypothetical protein